MREKIEKKYLHKSSKNYSQMCNLSRQNIITELIIFHLNHKMSSQIITFVTGKNRGCLTIHDKCAMFSTLQGTV